MNKDFTIKVAPISFDEAISIIHGYAERVFIEAVQCEDKQAKAVLCSKFAALSKAQAALEKQKPKKIKDGTHCGYHNCGKLVFSNENFCSRCGQALDWGDIT